MDPARTSSSDSTLDDRTVGHLIDHLAVADPQAAQRMSAHLTGIDPSTVVPCLDRRVDDVIEALAVEVSHGRDLAEGIGRMLAEGLSTDLERYCQRVKNAAARGPTLAGLLARHLVPVLISGDPALAEQFDQTVRIMLQKGTYTLNVPLESLSALIAAKERTCAHAFLDLLAATYDLDLSYNRTVYLTHTLPRAVDRFTPSRRLWQIQGMTRMIRTDERLADGYLRGLASGLDLLSEPALNTFLDQVVHRCRHSIDRAMQFLSLESRGAVELCRALQVVVPLSAVRPELERYLRARTGLAVAVRPLSDLSGNGAHAKPYRSLVRCDGRAIYLPDEMDLLQQRVDNADLYKLLVRLEAGSIEFGTYDLDADKALDDTAFIPAMATTVANPAESELERFLRAFECPTLALDLFILLEHARIARRIGKRYPGLRQRLIAALCDPHLTAGTGIGGGGTWFPLYRHLVLGQDLPADPAMRAIGRAMADGLNQPVPSGGDTVESSARWVIHFYTMVTEGPTVIPKADYRTLVPPWGRRLDPTHFGPFQTIHRRLAADIHSQLTQRDIRVYRSDLQQLLGRQNGQVSLADIHSLIVKPSLAPAAVDLSWLDLTSLMCRHGLGSPVNDSSGADTFRYREWDWCMGDYLPDRVRVRVSKIDAADPAFYRQTLDRFSGLARRIRYAFERLRPEAITILRQWREGDAFDYRALLDFILDRKAGLMPSDRLFVKRIKQVRDVAVLLLFDLSRSTA
ncbi:MAG: hypothetical protein WBY88_12380, partial [Desulfosarcina sp.]